VRPWDGEHDLVRGLTGQANRLACGGRKHHQAGAGVHGQPLHLGRRQIERQVMHEPAILTQAGRGHQGRQAVPFPRRRGRHRDAPRAAVRLLRTGRDQPLADGAGPVFGRDRQLARGPVIADPRQRGRDHPLAQVGERHAAFKPGEKVPSPGLVAGHDRGVQPVRLGRPVADPDLRPRRGARGPARRQGGDVLAVDLVAAAGLPGRKQALADPSVSGLVVHPEDVGGLS
jgi:hypothetical protein